LLPVLGRYLASVRSHLHLDATTEREALEELETHIDDRVRELKESGLSEEDAAHTTLRRLGSAKMVARQIYEAHVDSTWKQALLAAIPHMLFGLIFALNWWQAGIPLVAMLALIALVTIYGWWRGRSVWFFSWLGYSLIPVVTVGLLLLYLPHGFSWVAIVVYVPIALWFLYFITVDTIKRDWLYSSLMLFPIPVIVGWLIVVGFGNHFPSLSAEGLRDFGFGIGMSFVALAATVVLFIRMRSRAVRMAVLAISGCLILVLVFVEAQGRMPWYIFGVLVAFLIGTFLTPALLERRFRKQARKPTL
jgi:hypothetical protein